MTFNNQYEFDSLVNMVADKIGRRNSFPQGCCPPNTIIKEGSISVIDTSTLDLAGTGTTIDPVYGNVRVSAQAGNLISITPDGLFVPFVPGGGGGEGTLESFAAGNAGPFFNTVVSNPTTTPLLQFNILNAPAHSYLGNNSASAALPIYSPAQALSRTNDTNVTLTLGGVPDFSLLTPVSLTLGWQGALSLARGGTGVSMETPASDVIMFYDSSAGRMQFLNVGDGLTITGTSIEADAVVYQETFPKQLVGFIVGDTGMTAGSTTYTNPDLAGKATNEVLVFVDGIKIFPNRTGVFSYVLIGTTIEFTAGLVEGTTVELYLIPPDPAPTVNTIYYGAKATAGAPNASQILAGAVTSQDGSDDVVINFTPYNASLQYLWFAIPDLGPEYRKYTWFDTTLNNGSIGVVPSDTFGAPTIVNVSGQNYLVIITNFATQFAAPLTMI